MKIKNTIKKKPKFNFANMKVPHTYVIIFTMICIAALATYIIPAGEYSRYENSTGIEVVDPNTYVELESNPTKLIDIFNAFPRGMEATASLIFFVFIVGGAFQIINGTYAIEVGISKLITLLGDRELFVIPIFLAVFSMGGMLFGMSNEVIVFVPIGISLARKMGYDALVGTSMITLGALAGFSAGAMNPFNVGVAQSIAELPMFSGAWFRIIMQITFILIASFYIMRYAKMVKEEPKKSYLFGDGEHSLSETNMESMETNMTRRHVAVLITIGIGFTYLIYNVLKYEWVPGKWLQYF